MAQRKNSLDFQRDVAGKSMPGKTFAATPNPDGTHAVQKNGATLHRVFYVPSSGAQTDGNAADRVIIFFNDGTIGIADAQAYIENHLR